MAEQRDVRINIDHVTTGLDRIQASIDEQRKLGGETGALQEEFDALRAALGQLDLQSALIDQLSDAERSLEAARTKAAALAEEQGDLRAAVASAGTAQAAAAAEYAQAADRLAALDVQVKQHKENLARLKVEQEGNETALNEAKVAYGANSEEVQQLTARQRELAEAVAAEKLAQAATNVEKKKAEQAASALNTELKAQNAELKQSESALNANSTAADRTAGDTQRLEGRVAELRSELNAAGVNTENLAAEQDRLARELDEAGRAASEFGRDVDEALSGAQAASKRSSLGISALGTAVGNLAAGAIERAKDAVFDLGRRMFSLGGDMESARTQFARLEGSLEAGNRTLDTLRRLSNETGTAFEKNREIYAQLKNFGIDPLNGSLQAIIDQTAALGGGQQRAEGIALALGQAYAKQKLQGEELLQLVERGVPVYALLEEALGKNAKEIQELATKGELGRDAIDKLIAAMGRAADGAAAAGINNLNGLLEQARSRLDQFLTRVAESGPLQVLKENLQGVNGALKDSDTAAETTGRIFVQTFGVLQAVGGTIRVAFNTVTLAINGLLLGVVKLAEGANRALAAVTFGETSERFAREADNIRAAADTLREQLEQDYRDIGAGAALVVEGYNNIAGAAANSATAVADAGAKSTAATDKQGKSAADAADKNRELADGADSAATASGMLASEIIGLATATDGAAKGLDKTGESAEGAAESAQKAQRALKDFTAEELQAGIDEIGRRFSGTTEQLDLTNAEVGRLKFQLDNLPASLAELEGIPAQFEAAKEKAAGLRQGLDDLGVGIGALREEQLRRLGLDASEIATGISDDFADIEQGVINLAGTLQGSSDEIAAAYEKLADSADTVEEVERALELLEDKQIQAALGAERLAEAQQELRDRLGDITSAANGAADAYATLGITSSNTLRQQADDARAAFETLQRLNEPLADQERAWLKVAEAELKAAEAAGEAELRQVTAALRAEAKTQEQRAAIDQLTGAYDEAGAAAERMGESARSAGLQATLAARETAQALADQARAADRTQQSYVALFEAAKAANLAATGSSTRNPDGSVLLPPRLPPGPLDFGSFNGEIPRFTSFTRPAGFQGFRSPRGSGSSQASPLTDQRRQELDQLFGRDPSAAPPPPPPTRTITLEFRGPDGLTRTATLIDDAGAEDFLDRLEAIGGTLN